MTRRTIVICAFLALGAGAVLAADFWESKKFPEWSDKEVARMLHDSPWAKTFKVGLEGFGRVTKVNDQKVGPELTFTMCWHTALPIRQARARSRFGKEAGTSKEAADMLAAPQSVYAVTIFGTPAKAIKGGVDQLKAEAQLKIKGQPPIQALQVRTEAQGPDQTVIFLFFPRTQPGARVITVEDREVEVTLKLPSGQITRKFNLKDMLFNGKLEL